MVFDRVQDSNEEQEFWMTRIYWVEDLTQSVEIFVEHANGLSRWKQCCSVWKQCLKKTMYKYRKEEPWAHNLVIQLLWYDHKAPSSFNTTVYLSWLLHSEEAPGGKVHR